MMRKEEKDPPKFISLTEAHRAFDLPKPQHPLVSLIDNKKTFIKLGDVPISLVLSFYKISYRTKLTEKLKYGQEHYDFDEGGLLFAAPDQLIGIVDSESPNGYSLFFSPDFLMNYPLARKINQYGFFSYAVNEALHLSEK
ncbi:hypothetical protein [Mucilaginibacter lacusdianchii]|uniref:hypothetical protein n=1 Tax=Mucilaginibacter lacusdianchii TaxID=2684211 RepID=UPI0034E27CAD